MRHPATTTQPRASALEHTGQPGSPATLTERKRQVSRWAANWGLDYGTSKIARLANRVQKHDPTMTAAQAADFLDALTGRISTGRVHGHADPTPAEALHHVHSGECRTCGRGMRHHRDRAPHESLSR